MRVYVGINTKGSLEGMSHLPEKRSKVKVTKMTAS